MNQEQIDQFKKIIEERINEDRKVMVTFLLSSCIALECADILSKSPHEWIRQDVKSSFKNFDRIFKARHKKDLNNLFALTDENSAEGEIFISTQEGVQYFLEEFGKRFARIPSYYYPELLERIDNMDFKPVEMVSEFKAKLNVDEGAE